MDLLEYRTNFINEINAEAVNSVRYPVEVFIDNAVDILKNVYKSVGDMEQIYYEFKNGTRAFKNMHIDGAYLDLEANCLNLLYANYNASDMASITNTVIDDSAQLLLNFFENVLKGFFIGAEESTPYVQLARDIRNNLDSIYQIHLFVVSTDKLSTAVKKLQMPDYVFKDNKNKSYKVVLDVLDIDKIYKSILVDFQKEDLVINTAEYGVSGIPCIKADIETDQYDSYLAIVPGEFLADIYLANSTEILESNVRSFLKFNGAVNKGIKGTILNEKSRFFTYNNGISTTAKSIELKETKDGLFITSFVDLQIINGGQTTATLAATKLKFGADLSGIFVQMKLTVLKNNDPELIRNIATYANSQNKVKTADLNSGHPFYVRMEDYSRKIYAPLSSGQLVQQLWFFERARGQYEQPLMQMTKAKIEQYKAIRPKNKKFTLLDLAKYMNASLMQPHYVSWGGEVNAAHFHNAMVVQWEKNDKVFNEQFYKELIGKKILFSYIENVISDQTWYQEKRAYRPQLVAYTFSKFVYEGKQLKKEIDYLSFWNKQAIPDFYYSDIARIAKLVFDIIYDDSRSTANIETYCKKEECWKKVKEKQYSLSDHVVDALLSSLEKKVADTAAEKDQKTTNAVVDVINIYNKGVAYWESLIARGQAQRVLTYADILMLQTAINYCKGTYAELRDRQVQSINQIVAKLKENGIE